MEEALPPGWIKENIGGRTVFFSPSPDRIKIDCNATLKHQHKRGKFLNVASLNFKRKKLVKQQTVQKPIFPEPVCPVKIEFSRNEDKINSDLEKVAFAVKQLTIDPLNPVDHRKELEAAAKLLNKSRNSSSVEKEEMDSDFSETRAKLTNCKNMEEIVVILAESPFIRNQLSTMEKSSILEEMLSMGRSYNKGPLNSFPPNVNRNLYADIVRYGLENAPRMISLLIDLHTDRDKCISPENVIKIGFSFSQLAASVNDKLSALSKVKCLGLKSGGLSKEALDVAAVTGMTQSSRCVAEQNDFLAGISWELIAEHAKKYPHQSTMDNMDMKRNGIQHHLTLSFIEIEQKCTEHLSTQGMSYEETLELFKTDLLLINSVQNKEAKEQLLKVITINLGRIFAREIPALKFMLKVLPNHYNSI